MRARKGLATNRAVTDLCERLAHKGIVEQPPGSNNQWFGRRYIFNRVAWCAISQSVVLDILKSVWLIGGKTALAADFMYRAKAGKNGMKWIKHSENARVGDYPVWSWGRNGRADHVSRIRTIRGHRGTTHGGNENSRWGVMHRDFRTVSEGGYVLGFARPAYGTKPRRRVHRVVGGLALFIMAGSIITSPPPAKAPVKPKAPVSQPAKAKPPVKKAVGPVVKLGNVRYGKRNGDVLDAERALRKRGYSGFAVNRKYGTGTVKAMARYQKRTNHKVNGKRPNTATLRSLGLRVR